LLQDAAVRIKKRVKAAVETIHRLEGISTVENERGRLLRRPNEGPAIVSNQCTFRHS